jgi:hypothetical protein
MNEDFVGIDDYVLRVLIRFYRGSDPVRLERPRVNPRADLEVLRLYWALGPALDALLQHIDENHHEIQAVLVAVPRIDDVRVRGRLDARASLLRQHATGHPTAMVMADPARTYKTAPNEVLCWTLDCAARLLRRLEAILPEQSTQRDRWEARVHRLQNVLRIQQVSRLVQEAQASRRPSGIALAAASRSRRPLYRLAAAACRELGDLERGMEGALHRVLGYAVLGPLYAWQRFELAVGLAVASALADVLKEELSLSLIGAHTVPIATVGRIAIWWQQRTEHYAEPVLEPSEERERSILTEYGLAQSSDRPDLVLIDSHAGAALAVIEVKYSNADPESGYDAIRAAVEQLVRYTRGYATGGSLDALLSRSVVALLKSSLVVLPMGTAVPALLDFSALQSRPVLSWAATLAKHTRKPAA